MKNLSLVENKELPDATLPQAEREQLKKVVEAWEKALNHHQLMYLACAFEDAARRSLENDE